MTERKNVFIGSTIHDLPQHRQQVLHACARQSMDALLPDPGGALAESLRLLDQADVYLGVWAHRYGPLAKGHQFSSAELEYSRAVERGLPRLIFLMHPEHPIKASDVETGPGADKLKTLRARLTMGDFNTFESPQELRQHVINRLSTLREPDLTAFHYVHDIPDPPAPYIAHPYTLLHTRDLVGRQAELNLLTDWVTDKLPGTYQVPGSSPRILNVVAIGGMGKSALTWKWFNEIAPQEMRPLAGRLWWSFYESDARFENFVTRALAYVEPELERGSPPAPGSSRLELRHNLSQHFNVDELRTLCFSLGIEDEDLPGRKSGMVRELIRHCERHGRTPELLDLARQARPHVNWIVPATLSQRLGAIQKIPPPEREARLLRALDRHPYLLVLDGLERITIAHARMDAARLADDDLDQRTANAVAGAWGLPQSAVQSFTGQHRLRKSADPRAGAFLRKLARVRASRVLVSTRLYPAELQMPTGYPCPGSDAIFLYGLSDDDALNLWRAFGVSGSRGAMLPLFRTFDSHPLLLQALAREVARDRRAPGDFDRWRADHADFDPFRLPLVQVKSHVLAFALRGLDANLRRALHTIAAFRMAATYDTLTALLMGAGKPFPDENALDAALTELEDRGLLGWDKRANRYDLHPIVRGVVWSGLEERARQDVYKALHAHFEALPAIDDWRQVNSLEDLTPAIELYNTLIGLGRYDDAYRLFYERLERATHFRLSASRQRAELLEMLFPDGLEQLPRLDSLAWQALSLNALATAYHLSGQPERAASLFHRYISISEDRDDQREISIGLCNLAEALRLSGALRESEAAACRALLISREQGDRFWEAYSLSEMGLTLAARGAADDSKAALERSLQIVVVQNHTQFEGAVNAYLAQRALWLDDLVPLAHADRAWELAHVQRYEADFIRAARLQGAAVLALNPLTGSGQTLDKADERLHHALTRARAVNRVKEELAALVSLSELRRRQSTLGTARELLDDAWEPAARGPYLLLAADAYNVLAQIERDAGDEAAAVEAAREAYRRAWCDGPPFAYHWGLETARGHLEALGAEEPHDLPPFDEGRFEPMVETQVRA
jgi:tetratricopeptide (TPR) repeat protein